MSKAALLLCNPCLAFLACFPTVNSAHAKAQSYELNILSYKCITALQVHTCLTQLENECNKSYKENSSCVFIFLLLFCRISQTTSLRSQYSSFDSLEAFCMLAISALFCNLGIPENFVNLSCISQISQASSILTIIAWHTGR